MRTKSVLALLVALTVLMTAFLPGCGKKAETTTPATTVEQSAGTPVQEPVKEKKEIEISIAFWDFQEFGNDEIGKKMANDLKIKIKTQPLSWDNDLEQVKLFGASGNMPDIIATYTVDSDITRFYGWIDQGLLRDIPDEMIAKYPAVKNVVDSNKILQAVKKIKGGKTWYIPRPESLKNYYVASHQVFYYRKDWMANVGITKQPETVDEFFNMLKAFTFNDPDKNGKADTYGLTSAGMNTAPFGIWGINPGNWQQEDGKWIPGYFSKKNIEPLKYYRKLYQEKVFDPEFSKNGWKQAIQKFTTNTFGVLIRNGDLHWLNKTIFLNWATANTDVKDPLAVVGVLDPMKKDAGTPPSWQMFQNSCGSEISSKVDDEKLDRILELYEYMMNPEVRMMLMHGIEGVDYKIQDGKLIPTIDPATNKPVNLGAKYPSTMINCLTDWYWDEDIESPYTDYPQGIKDLSQHVRDTFNPLAIIDNLAIGYVSTPTKDTTTIQWTDAYTQIVMGTDDVEAMFNKFVQESMDKGMAKAIEELNVKVKELGVE